VRQRHRTRSSKALSCPRNNCTHARTHARTHIHTHTHVDAHAHKQVANVHTTSGRLACVDRWLPLRVPRARVAAAPCARVSSRVEAACPSSSEGDRPRHTGSLRLFVQPLPPPPPLHTPVTRQPVIRRRLAHLAEENARRGCTAARSTPRALRSGDATRFIGSRGAAWHR
jgi:hypothetical protein